LAFAAHPNPTTPWTIMNTQVTEPEIIEAADPEILVDSLEESIEDADPIKDEADTPARGELALIPSSALVPRDRALDPLALYLQEIKKFQPLTPEEEFELARRYRDEHDEKAAFTLITANLRLVVRIAMDFQRRWMKNVLDLIQEGNIGLIKAVQKFDPDKGIKFSYYAAFWIKAYILKFIMDNWRMVKIGTTQAQRKLFYNLSKERQRLQSLGYDPDTSTMAKNLQVSEADIVEMGQRLGQNDLSLDMQVGDDSDSTPLDFIPALEAHVEDRMASEEMSELLLHNIEALKAELNDKERDILESRLLAETPVTLREIGEKYGITRERVRQIEARLLQKIKERMQQTIHDFSEEWIHESR
jgi:RNA polymerase sigma-32 factor